MSDLPKAVMISEHGVREGFQFEPKFVPTERKIALIDALSLTGLKSIQVAGFSNPTLVKGWADAEAVVAGIRIVEGVRYTGSYLNDKGLERAIATGRLTILGTLNTSASEIFLKRNQNQDFERNRSVMAKILSRYIELGVTTFRVGVMAAFGCNFSGAVPVSSVIAAVRRAEAVCTEAGVKLGSISLQDTMAWATPLSIQHSIGVLRETWPDAHIALHLHDTRGLAIANAYAALQLGVDDFDASVGGLGGCPFGGHKGAAGNVCTEDLVFMCEEVGIQTGIDLAAIREAALLAQDIVGHPLPGKVKDGGGLVTALQA